MPDQTITLTALNAACDMLVQGRDGTEDVDLLNLLVNLSCHLSANPDDLALVVAGDGASSLERAITANYGDDVDWLADLIDVPGTPGAVTAEALRTRAQGD